MNLIIPMGGQGKRLRPHTLTKPKAFLPIAGKTILERIVEEIYKTKNKANEQIKIDKVGFVVNEINDDAQFIFEKIAKNVNAEPKIYIQEKPLGTAHAIYQAAELLKGEVLIAFSDTIFKGDLKIDQNIDGIIWTKKVEDPSAFGVVSKNEQGFIKTIIEKPQIFVSDEAIIGIYYFNEASKLKDVIESLINNDQKTQGEFQLTDAISNLIEQKQKFICQNVNLWLDCGNKDAIIKTQKIILEQIEAPELLISKKAHILNSIIIPPVFIGDNAIIHNSVIGPYVSIGESTNIYDSRIKNSIIQDHSITKNINLNDAMLGSYVNFIGKPTNANVGDYSNTIIN